MLDFFYSGMYLHVLLSPYIFFFFFYEGAQWLSGRVLDSRPKGLNLTGVTALWSMSKKHLSQLSTGSTQENPSLNN